MSDIESLYWEAHKAKQAALREVGRVLDSALEANRLGSNGLSECRGEDRGHVEQCYKEALIDLERAIDRVARWNPHSCYGLADAKGDIADAIELCVRTRQDVYESESELTKAINSYASASKLAGKLWEERHAIQVNESLPR